jgi:hypothetical protein
LSTQVARPEATATTCLAHTAFRVDAVSCDRRIERSGRINSVTAGVEHSLDACVASLGAAVVDLVYRAVLLGIRTDQDAGQDERDTRAQTANEVCNALPYVWQ